MDAFFEAMARDFVINMVVLVVIVIAILFAKEYLAARRKSGYRGASRGRKKW